MTPRYAMQDTKKPDGCYVQFERTLVSDDSAGAPDTMSDGFWPSRDANAAGYVPPDRYDAELSSAQIRMAAWKRGDWEYVGIRAVANIFIVKNGVGVHTTLESPGLWGVESDSGESYLQEVFDDQVAELKDMLAAMATPTFE